MASIVLGMSTSQIALLSTKQISGLTTSDIVALTTDQVQALSSTQVSALSVSNLGVMSTAQFATMSTAEVNVLTGSQVAALSTAVMGALSTNQAGALSTAAIAALKTAQVVALSTASVDILDATQVSALSVSSLGVMSTAQFATMTTAEVNALTGNQVASLSTAVMGALSTNQAGALSTTAIAALKTAQVVALSTSNVAILSTAQIDAITMAQIQVLTTSQVAALGASLGALNIGSPIILDLNGDGVKTMSVTEGVKFDVFATGNKVNTGWVSGADGLLVLDRNHDGVINDGSELFGTATNLANGQKASDGYAALREFDSNSDGAITSADAAFKDLQVWVDSNSDGVTETGELKSLASLGITSISAEAKVDLSKDSGNLVGLTSSYQTDDGQTHAAADVWFVADKQAAYAPAAQVTEPTTAAVAPPPQTEAQLSTALDWNLGPDVANAEPVKVATAPPASDLRSMVSGLAQAIGSFAAGPDPSTPSAPGQLPGVNGATGATLAVGGMVDAMKQFDANGNPVGASVPLAAPLPSTASSILSDPLKTATLASPIGKLPS